MKEIYGKFINKMLKNLDELILRLIKYFKNFSKSKTGIDYGGIKQNIKNNEDGGLTITEARRISSELGFTNRTTKTQGQEPDLKSKKIDNGKIGQDIKISSMEKLTISVARQAELDRGFTHRTTKTQGQEPAHQLKKIDNGETRQNIKNNEHGSLTLSKAIQILSELGINQRPTKTQGQEPRTHSKIILKKDMAKNRDMEFKEQIIQEIMENRKVSREEAARILANPW